MKYLPTLLQKTNSSPTLDIILTRGTGFSGPILRTLMASPWAHCGIVDGGSVIEAIPSEGVTTRSLGEAVRETHTRIHYQVNDPRKAIAWARTQIGKPYDMSAVFGLMFRSSWGDQGKWFCSELVANAISLAGGHQFPVSASRITPRDIWIAGDL